MDSPAKESSLPCYEFLCSKDSLMAEFSAILDAHRNLNCPMVVFKIFCLGRDGQLLYNEYRFHGLTFTARLIWREETSDCSEKDVDDYLSAKAVLCRLFVDTANLPDPRLKAVVD
ncbi:MAG: hypothetical protein AB1403_00515 [Candidatus Riflebacteria bacterium]